MATTDRRLRPYFPRTASFAGPSASRTPALSLALDRRALYFDCRHPTDLEELLKTYDFEADAAPMARACPGIALLTESGISKFEDR
ncbi:capsular polysaccharide biosynthesis protein [Sinorhizobium meliloti CCNWSX0020]|uniref:Capsular polysaccharide biosynthesis protein n=1 Tax=Sinorhizobium meliloti CCNWSX0020 TaxID=1107881 RepID=H0G5V7_RHIML|nr:capsular polysaccharide biosynthesis protein [Sinorhizobium meliloti CCNWSX0020]